MSYLKSFLIASGIGLLVAAMIAGLAWTIVFHTAYAFVAIPVGMFLLFWGLVHDEMNR